MKTNTATETMTREQAIAKLVDLDVARWGEQERAASAQLRSRLSHGLALHAVAVSDLDRIDNALIKAAKALMTRDDLRVLRAGG